MATVKRCDRCGKIMDLAYEAHYELFNRDEKERVVLRDVDLCQKCKDDLVVFMRAPVKDTGIKTINEALDIAYQYSQIDGAHHKAWCIDQMVRILTGDNYDAWVEYYKHNAEDPQDDYYEWDVGIAP